MTYIGQVRVELSFLDHRDPEMWIHVARYLGELFGEVGLLLFYEWTRHDTAADFDITASAVEEALGLAPWPEP